jgi:hypothetical protein
MLRWRRQSAVLTLMTMLLPWPATAALALHEADDHVAAHPDLAAVLHGHDHAKGTPAHDHSLMPSPNMTSGHSRAFVAIGLRAASVSLSGLPLQPPAIARPVPSETGSPPDGSRTPESVLRI